MRHIHKSFNYARMAGVGDNWTPPDDLPWIECPCCSGRKSVMKLDEDNKPWRDVCEVCRGTGLLDAETGEPYDRDALAKLAEGD